MSRTRGRSTRRCAARVECLIALSPFVCRSSTDIPLWSALERVCVCAFAVYQVTQLRARSHPERRLLTSVAANCTCQPDIIDPQRKERTTETGDGRNRVKHWPRAWRTTMRIGERGWTGARRLCYLGYVYRFRRWKLVLRANCYAQSRRLAQSNCGKSRILWKSCAVCRKKLSTFLSLVARLLRGQWGLFFFLFG